MNITDLNEYLLANSLQHFVGDDIEVTEEVLSGLVKKGINVYGNYRPILTESRELVSTYSNPLKSLDGRTITNITELYYIEPILGGPEGKCAFPWKWNREEKNLRTQIGGSYWIVALVMPLLDDLEFDQTEFLDLMQGLYMMYVGESRKAFTLAELPFENDGQDIYNDGKELYEKTVLELGETNSNWWHSIL